MSGHAMFLSAKNVGDRGQEIHGICHPKYLTESREGSRKLRCDSFFFFFYKIGPLGMQAWQIRLIRQIGQVKQTA